MKFMKLLEMHIILMKKNNKKLVLKVISAGSCLLYHTDFIISDSIVEEISNKYA